MKKALAALPWVEYSTIKTDLDSHKVTFGVNDRKSFSVDALREALGKRYGEGMEVVQGPDWK